MLFLLVRRDSNPHAGYLFKLPYQLGDAPCFGIFMHSKLNDFLNLLANVLRYHVRDRLYRDDCRFKV